jgi:hypothetical protein
MEATSIKRKLSICCVISLLLQMSACKKNTATNKPVPVVISNHDSDLLIKNIQYKSNSNFAIDSESYFYDTLNNKIIIDSRYENASSITKLKIELSYNAQHLLTGILHKFKPENSTDTNIVLTVKFDYDDEGVLKKIEQKDFYDSIKTTLFNKTLLTGGNYQLSWTEPPTISIAGQAEAAQIMQAVFNQAGELLSKWNLLTYWASGKANDTTSIIVAAIVKDTFLYDAQGSLFRKLTNYVDTFHNVNDSFTRCEVKSRLTSGNNLYNQRQRMLRGIANIPFGMLVISSQAGVLSIFNADGIEPFEFSKYPFQSMEVHSYFPPDNYSFTGVSELDSKQRLIHFVGFLNDGSRLPLDYRITYY